MVSSAPCVFCSREITNPICAKCNFRHVVLWANDRKLDFDSRIKLIKGIKKKVFIKNRNDLDCIICSDHKVYVCSYCFFKKAERIVNEINPPSLANSFHLVFNYEIYTDYIYLPRAKTKF